MRFRLLRCLAKALARNGLKLLSVLVPGGEVLYDIAAETWEDYRREAGEDVLRQEVQELAQAPADRVRKEAEQAVEATASRLSTDEREALAAYLNQVPASIRRTLRRPADPTGTTVPATRHFNRPEDLLRLLPPRPPRFRPGQRPFPGMDWVLEELVGIGGFGEVWKARQAHARHEPPRAFKFCLDETMDIRSLEREVELLNRLGKHPGIVPLLDTYLSAKPACLAYEYVDGGDLTGLIRELHEQKRMTPLLASQLLLHLAEIVAYVHGANQPIVHSDLKPANVLVQVVQGDYQLRVTDFGIGALAALQAARETRQPTRSRQALITEVVRGAYTPLYASPEQMARRKGEKADTRDDVHALGVIWYQLVTGDLGMTSFPPEWRERLQERGMKKDQVELLGSCISWTAEKRPKNAGELARQLRALLPEDFEDDPNANTNDEDDRPRKRSKKTQKGRKVAPAKTGSIITGGIFAFVGVLIMVAALVVPRVVDGIDPLSPGIFGTILGVALIACGIVSFFNRGLRDEETEDFENDPNANIHDDDRPRKSMRGKKNQKGRKSAPVNTGNIVTGGIFAFVGILIMVAALVVPRVVDGIDPLSPGIFGTILGVALITSGIVFFFKK
jgi:serine/threonine protein kinase